MSEWSGTTINKGTRSSGLRVGYPRQRPKEGQTAPSARARDTPQRAVPTVTGTVSRIFPSQYRNIVKRYRLGARASRQTRAIPAAKFLPLPLGKMNCRRGGDLPGSPAEVQRRLHKEPARPTKTAVATEKALQARGRTAAAL